MIYCNAFRINKKFYLHIHSKNDTNIYKTNPVFIDEVNVCTQLNFVMREISYQLTLNDGN